MADKGLGSKVSAGAKAKGRKGRLFGKSVSSAAKRQRGVPHTPGAEKGAVIQAEDGAVIVQRDVPTEERVNDPKLNSYDAIAEALD